MGTAGKYTQDLGGLESWMKFLKLFPLVALLALTSCSAKIYSTGKYSDVLHYGSHKSTIRAAIGEPVECGITTSEQRYPLNGMPFDTFHVRGSVYDYHRYSGAAMAAPMTLGLSELSSVPAAIGWKICSKRPKELIVLYTADGEYRWHIVKPLPPDR